MLDAAVGDCATRILLKPYALQAEWSAHSCWRFLRARINALIDHEPSLCQRQVMEEDHLTGGSCLVSELERASLALLLPPPFNLKPFTSFKMNELDSRIELVNCLKNKSMTSLFRAFFLTSPFFKKLIFKLLLNKEWQRRCCDSNTKKANVCVDDASCR